MAYLIDTDGYNFLEDEAGFGVSRVVMSQNGIIYMCFVNSLGNIEIKRSFDGGQSWYHVGTIEDNYIVNPSIAINSDGSKVVVVWQKSIDDNIYYAFNSDNFIIKNFLVSNSTKSVYVYFAPDDINVYLAISYPYDSYYDYTRIYVRKINFDTEEYLTSTYNLFSDNYDCLLTDKIDNFACGIIKYPAYPYFFVCDVTSGSKVAKSDYTDSSYYYMQPKFAKSFTETGMFYMFWATVGTSTEPAKLKMYKIGLDGTYSFIQDVLVGETAQLEIIKTGHFQVLQDGVGDMYLLYVKPEPNDYLFMTKIDAATLTVYPEVQLTTEPARCPDGVKLALPNRSKVYYIYQRQPV